MKEKSLFALKFLVISIGMVLVGGILLVTVTIYQRNQGKVVQTGNADCAGGEMTLTGHVQQIVREGAIITLLLETKEHSQRVISIDSCTNQVVHTIILS